jgi:hypothetical protein
MYIQLTFKAISNAFKTLCSKKKVDFNKKDAEKMFKLLAEDDEVEKHYFCGAECVKSKRACMKEVDDEGM